MGKKCLVLQWPSLISLIALFIWSAGHSRAQDRRGAAQVTNYVIVVIEGRVEISRAGAQTFDRAATNAPLFVGDRVRIGPKSQLTIRRADHSIYRFYEKSEFQVPAPKPGTPTSATIRLLSGVLYFFHRGQPSPFEVETRTASAAVRGTEFNLQVDDAGATVITVIDGLVDLSNEVNTVAVQSGQQGVAEPGKAPFARAAIDAINVIQWTLYYPGILDPAEVPLTDQERSALSSSLNAYRSGDLLRAVNEYPTERVPQSEAEKIYLAQLMLAVGQADEAERLLVSVLSAEAPRIKVNLLPPSVTIPINWRLAKALQQVIAAVKLKSAERESSPELASGWLAYSYRLQSEANLEGALRAARYAVEKSPDFGFGWARVAELEFSFGRINAASEAVAKALQLSPRNAQAIALNGFLFAARNKMDSAIRQFDEAIAIDGSLANAWLGRGLCLIRTGNKDAGREDLLTAAALEPQRAFLRSYLGKAWADAGEKKLAEHELELAKQFDPHDPTAWLYSALLKQQYNRINEAIGYLEHAQNLSANRAVYRSEFLLDQDRAVRSVNLANIYRDAGMTDWSVREAGRAVSADYANYSAHLFLANSYDQLQDPNRVNLRYETAVESEYLIANLLAPVAAGTLSRSVSQGEYSSLFERNRFGVSSTTEYLSRGAWYQNGAQFGIFGNTAYSLEGIYRADPGQRVNNDFEERDLRLQVKQQLTYKDSVFVRATWLERSGGDVSQYYDPAFANPSVRTRERQEPILTLGYHHEWSPGVHTLLLASRLDDTYWVENPSQGAFLVVPDPNGLVYVEPVFARLNYRRKLELYTGEVQQIWQTPKHTTTLGMRFQTGDFNTASAQTDVIGEPTGYVPSFVADKTYVDEFQTPFERLSVYAYHQWQIHDRILLVGGLSYDRIVHPENFSASPINDATQIAEQFSPKAGLLWTPLDRTVVRGAYTRSLRGASIDQSLTIEPSQVAGINQAFRSLVSESVAGSDIGAKFETFDLSLDQQLETRTYIGVTGEILFSSNRRVLGTFAANPSRLADASSMREDIDYRERAVVLTIDQLVGRNWSVGSRYRLSNSRLDDSYPDIAPGALLVAPIRSQATLRSKLHQLDLHANFNHPSGFFAHGQAIWHTQSNSGYTTPLKADSFWHVNVLGGYRFFQRRAEIAVAILNLNDENYNLNPLTPYLELPRKRTCMVRVRINF